MKGIVFTEFLDFIESEFGLEMVDTIISQSKLESKGAYTSIGCYKFSEILELLKNLSINTNIPINDLLSTCGEHFFNLIETSYPNLIDTYSDSTENTLSTKNPISQKIKKINLGTKLPTYIVEEKVNNSLTSVPKSSKTIYNYGLVLMNRILQHFNATASIIIEKIKNDKTEVKFFINKS